MLEEGKAGLSHESKFHNLTKLSLLLVYLVIIAGAFVRMTGSGRLS